MIASPAWIAVLCTLLCLGIPLLIPSVRRDVRRRLLPSPRSAAVQKELIERQNEELCSLNRSLRNEIARRKAAEEQLRHTAYHDSLTGLPNRELFTEYHHRAFAKFNHRGGRPYAILFLDLDDFKYINDTFGHHAGDEILKMTAERLSHCVRDVDTIGRIGGDEFVVLIESFSDPSHTIKVAERIIEALSEAYLWEEHSLVSTASIGIAFAEARHAEPKEVIRDADAALYHAKAIGKRRYSIFQGELQRQATARMQIERALRETNPEGGFTLRYQPIIDLSAGKLHGFEALLRWEHPEIGCVSPSHFIPVAEQNGMIISLGRWALTRACCDLARWLEELGEREMYTMSVNISPKQLQRELLIEEVEHALHISGLAAGHLVLEVTEGAVISDPDTTLWVLNRLKELGVKLHLDDFGEGYSSVSLLCRFPFDSMKIDRSYVTGIAGMEHNLELVRTIIDLGHSMKKEVIAEGIEAPEEARVLRSFNCELGQGFYFSHPLNAEEARIFIGSDFSLERLNN